jgi:hypothetical protein
MAALFGSFYEGDEGRVRRKGLFHERKFRRMNGNEEALIRIA